MQMLFPLIVFVILILLDNVKGAGIDISVQTGGDLLLNVTVLKKFHLFYWQFNSKDTLVVFDSSGKPTVEKNYTGRIELSRDERSVKLKNLQKSDSGVYSAWGLGDKKELLDEYNVTVKDQNTATTVSPTAFSPPTVSSAAVSSSTVSPTAFSPTVSSDAVSSSTVSPTDSPTVFPTAITVLVIIAVAVAAAAILLWRHLKKKCQDQKVAVLFSANSGTNSPNVQILLPPPQQNGALHLPESNHLMEENTGDSAV